MDPNRLSDKADAKRLLHELGVPAPEFRRATGAGEAFGAANNTTMSVMDMLLATDAQTLTGVLYSGSKSRRSLANSVYGALNQAGEIG